MTSELVYHDPERLDLPSASDAYARRRCLGRHQLIRKLRQEGVIGRGPKTDETDADALRGTRIHAAWAGDLSPNALSSEEAGTLGALRRLEDMMVADWAAGQEYSLFSREQRLWFHIGLRPRHSGRFDVAYIQRAPWRMLILDGKTGFVGAEPADVNDQLRELVALAHHTYPAIEEFAGAILQPNVPQARSSIARFDAFDSELALRMLRQHLEDIEDPNHSRHPGAYCKFCPALAHCEEAQRHVLKLPELDQHPALYTLPLGPQGAWTIEHLKAAVPIIKRLLEDYKSVLSTDPEAIPGWRLKDGKTIREIQDAKAVWGKLNETLTFEEFTGALSVSVTKLEEIYGKVTKLKGKSLKERFNAQLADALTWKQNDPELENFNHELGKQHE